MFVCARACVHVCACVCVCVFRQGTKLESRAEDLSHVIIKGSNFILKAESLMECISRETIKYGFVY